MWRWPVVAAAKEKNAKAKAKVNTLHAKLISIAAEKWGDPSLNNSLADAIHAAKKDGVTADVIDRAIRRGTGLDKDGAKVEEILYEGYAPGGVAVIVRALTDNRNRTAPNIRHIFHAFGGSLGESGTVSHFAFEYKGVLTLRTPDDRESLEAVILDTNAEDYSMDDAQVTITTDRTELISTREILEAKGYSVESALFEYIAKNSTALTDEEHALKLYKMLEAFDQDEDVERVWNNAEIADSLWEATAQKVEASRFRT